MPLDAGLLSRALQAATEEYGARLDQLQCSHLCLRERQLSNWRQVFAAVRCARRIFTSCWLVPARDFGQMKDMIIFRVWVKKGQKWPMTRQVRNGRWLCICFSEWMKVNSFPMNLGILQKTAVASQYPRPTCIQFPQISLQQLTKPLCHYGLMKI